MMSPMAEDIFRKSCERRAFKGQRERCAALQKKSINYRNQIWQNIKHSDASGTCAVVQAGSGKALSYLLHILLPDNSSNLIKQVSQAHGMPETENCYHPS